MAHKDNEKERGLSTQQVPQNAPRVKFSGFLSVGDLKLPCYVLDDERRVLSGRGLQEVLRLTDGTKSVGPKNPPFAGSKDT